MKHLIQASLIGHFPEIRTSHHHLVQENLQLEVHHHTTQVLISQLQKAHQSTHVFLVKLYLHGFKGAGGYTITVQNDIITASYCHISPNFLYSVGQSISSNSIIAYVGPKYVYNVTGNPYKDSTGKSTNGATTGCHLHLTIKKDGKAVNPLNYF